MIFSIDLPESVLFCITRDFGLMFASHGGQLVLGMFWRNARFQMTDDASRWLANSACRGLALLHLDY